MATRLADVMAALRTPEDDLDSGEDEVELAGPQVTDNLR